MKINTIAEGSPIVITSDFDPQVMVRTTVVKSEKPEELLAFSINVDGVERELDPMGMYDVEYTGKNGLVCHLQDVSIHIDKERHLYVIAAIDMLSVNLQRQEKRISFESPCSCHFRASASMCIGEVRDISHKGIGIDFKKESCKSHIKEGYTLINLQGDKKPIQLIADCNYIDEDREGGIRHCGFSLLKASRTYNDLYAVLAGE